MARHDVHDASRRFSGSPELPNGGELPQVHSRVPDSALEAVAWDARLPPISPVTCETLFTCARALMLSWYGLARSESCRSITLGCMRMATNPRFLQLPGVAPKNLDVGGRMGRVDMLTASYS